ncbi:FtsQ-type POTRA domain-containing protein [Rathayibacter sp. VKM Ac-2803]|uniref:FtsQ-type POTRA domain-containing protein n=1 Tax=Rathayibacter sp. VKM Ac-2803 TaxID=2609256 RepID=UPI00135B31D5|nr:FtsQ-type POTRA domain-containing protein [Rathayibacter sp. VKM Ac-2803]MWV49688.1 FtsQ-type POTRA domain-containing protein [Rathayibacter sp. VKM Ac-2803]
MKRPEGARTARPPGRSAPVAPPPASSGEPTEPISIVAPSVSEQKPSRGQPEPIGLVDRTKERLGRVRLPGADRREIARAAKERRRFERGEVRRFTRRARRRRTIALVTAGSLVLLAVVVAIAAYSPLMAVRTIEIAGTQRVSAQAIQSSLDDQLGVPLTLVDRSEVGAVLGAYPLVQSYSVQTRPPSTLVVTIVERTPLAVLANGGRFDLVDAAGVVIETADAAQPGYPIVTTPTGGASGAAFRVITQVLRTVPANLAGQVTAASATTGDDVSLTLANGSVVMWGGSDDSALKAVVLEKLMAATDPAAVATYDVSSPQAAVVAPR